MEAILKLHTMKQNAVKKAHKAEQETREKAQKTKLEKEKALVAEMKVTLAKE
jgi:hypothetical protein